MTSTTLNSVAHCIRILSKKEGNFCISPFSLEGGVGFRNAEHKEETNGTKFWSYRQTWTGPPRPADDIQKWLMAHEALDINIPERFPFCVDITGLSGKWENPFDKEDTEEAPFFVNPLSFRTRSSCLMMNMVDYFWHYVYSEFRVVKLPYANGTTSMFVFLHDGDLGCCFTLGFIARAAQAISDSLQPQQNLTETNLLLPKWSNFSTVETKFDQFHVRQLVKVEVDESGTEAKAQTTGYAAGACSMPKIASFIANRPFLYLIYDTRYGVLFLGKIENPTKG